MKRKKFLAVVLATVMTMSTAMTVCTADESGGSDSKVSSSTSSKKTTTITVTTERSDIMCQLQVHEKIKKFDCHRMLQWYNMSGYS